jgi:hypothetical protein
MTQGVERLPSKQEDLSLKKEREKKGQGEKFDDFLSFF